jgi:hypothetical protein
MCHEISRNAETVLALECCHSKACHRIICKPDSAGAVLCLCIVETIQASGLLFKVQPAPASQPRLTHDDAAAAAAAATCRASSTVT